MFVTMILALSVPEARSYIMQTTDRPADEIVACVQMDWEDVGKGDVTATDYGHRVDYRYSNLGGSVKEPTLSLEVHDGPQRTLIMYGYGTWRGAIKGVWGHTAKKCFPELRKVEVIKPR